jgi:cellulose synthase/poly-beta-1,6-N-acetylglucosamine synthase-like glycosyltransferase
LIAQFLFWFCVTFIFYVYCGYPAILYVMQRVITRPVRKGHFEPFVSLVIAVHNERASIEKKIRNCLNLDYPKSKLQIIVSLDGSTDGTALAVRKYVSQGIEVVHSKSHHGKAVALNRGLCRAKGEIVVFADVRQEFDRMAIRELVANFADETVGAASGELFLEGKGAADVGLYWRYEKAIRSMESNLHSVVGATGAIYAIRRGLFEPVPEDTILDDVLIPMRAVLKGKRAIFDPAARAFDTVACCPAAEYGRKVRTLTGNFQILTQAPELLSPWRNPIFIQFLSHKVGRLLVPYALLGAFVSNLFLLRTVGYGFLFLFQCLWYLLAAAGCVLGRRGVVKSPSPVLEEQVGS